MVGVEIAWVEVITGKTDIPQYSLAIGLFSPISVMMVLHHLADLVH
jgi:hypothetical protein